MKKEEALKKLQDVINELKEAGYAVEPILRSSTNALFADIQLRPLTVDEVKETSKKEAK